MAPIEPNRPTERVEESPARNHRMSSSKLHSSSPRTDVGRVCFSRVRRRRRPLKIYVGIGTSSISLPEFAPDDHGPSAAPTCVRVLLLGPRVTLRPVVRQIFVADPQIEVGHCHIMRVTVARVFHATRLRGYVIATEKTKKRKKKKKLLPGWPQRRFPRGSRDYRPAPFFAQRCNNAAAGRYIVTLCTLLQPRRRSASRSLVREPNGRYIFKRVRHCMPCVCAPQLGHTKSGGKRYGVRLRGQLNINIIMNTYIYIYTCIYYLLLRTVRAKKIKKKKIAYNEQKLWGQRYGFITRLPHHMTIYHEYFPP